MLYYLHRKEFFGAFSCVPAHVSGFNDPNDHFSVLFNSFESCSSRHIVIILNRFQLFEYLTSDTADL